MSKTKQLESLTWFTQGFLPTIVLAVVFVAGDVASGLPGPLPYVVPGVTAVVLGAGYIWVVVRLRKSLRRRRNAKKVLDSLSGLISR